MGLFVGALEQFFQIGGFQVLHERAPEGLVVGEVPEIESSGLDPGTVPFSDGIERGVEFDHGLLHKEGLLLGSGPYGLLFEAEVEKVVAVCARSAHILLQKIMDNFMRLASLPF